MDSLCLSCVHYDKKKHFCNESMQSLPKYTACITCHACIKNTIEPFTSVAQAIKALAALTDEQRKAVFDAHCVHCGSVDPHCTCHRDE